MSAQVTNDWLRIAHLDFIDPVVCQAVNPLCDRTAEWRRIAAGCAHLSDRVYCDPCKQEIQAEAAYGTMTCRTCAAPAQIDWERL